MFEFLLSEEANEIGKETKIKNAQPIKRNGKVFILDDVVINKDYRITLMVVYLQHFIPIDDFFFNILKTLEGDVISEMSFWQGAQLKGYFMFHVPLNIYFREKKEFNRHKENIFHF